MGLKGQPGLPGDDGLAGYDGVPGSPGSPGERQLTASFTSVIPSWYLFLLQALISFQWFMLFIRQNIPYYLTSHYILSFCHLIRSSKMGMYINGL